MVALEAWRSYRDARDNAERTIQNLVRVLSEQTARTFQSVDLSLLSISNDLAEHPEMADNDAGFRSRLRNRLHSLPYVRALFVIGADGFISHDTDYPATPRVSLADRPYFLAQKNDATIGLYFGRPLRSRSVGVWFISLSRSVKAAGGGFGGIVVAAVEPLYFEAFYRQLWVGGGTIALLLQDGTLLARSPQQDEAIGKSFASSEPFRSLLAKFREGTFWSTSPIDTVRRLAGFQAVAGTPVVMIVTLNEDDVMQPWRAHVTVLVIGGAIVLAMLTFLEVLARWYRRREALTQEALAQAERLESIGRFAGGVAHDFGNSLRIIRSAFSLLRPLVAKNPDATALLVNADRSVGDARELIEQLLSISRNRNLMPAPCELNGLILTLLPILKQAAGPRIEIDFRAAQTELTSLVDAPRFKAAVLNLVLNSRDAMPSGGVVTIRMRVADALPGKGREGWVEISVRDEGLGMSPAVIRHAMDPFFTTKELGRRNGLGLNQVYVFMKQSGGSINISSEEGTGTIVKLYFPRLDGAVHPKATA
ncbi:hybrid sensor histidine kinase/response regulator [Mesorhizobium japonicum]|uniref:histidine kinase n=1 Tax=Mesorhizobium japonicum (strain LMG 29417 / CECT 9101 / MAFF 303099) TaxID=266835 RepID=Q98DH8_RHILO|nr:hybrid sensor histidine kinase/response regulator [Mesorhizobium japonicum]BAB51293.1 two-component system histidine protein kinase (FixL like) [Mesorhizobium japonicum MAFF 303099]